MALPAKPSGPAHSLDHQSLRLTVQLLRPNAPHLAALLEGLGPAQNHFEWEYELLLHSLGAHTVGKIIQALTTIGEHWLGHDNGDVSVNALRQLLDHWIDLGDWIVHHAAPH